MTVEEFSFSLHGFTGKVRLFPLPGLVLFPHVMQPLHVFEPRYRDLLAAALAGDQLVAMALLQPGWESDYEGRPPIHPVACLSRVSAHHQLENGSSNILVSGLKRVCVLREYEPQHRYREAEVEIIEDYCPPVEEEVGDALHRRLREAFVSALPRIAESREQLEQLVHSDISLAVLTDIVGYMLDIGLSHKALLLAEANIHRRAELLLEYLAATAMDTSPGSAGAVVFPPDFSVN